MSSIATAGQIRILCISPVFAPRVNSEAFCSAKMVAALMDAGASVTVLHSMEYTSGPELRDSSAMWQRVAAVAHDVHAPQCGAVARLGLAAQYQSNCSVRWVDAAVRQAKQLHAEVPFDLVYSRSLPMFAHIAGYWCAKALKLPWVANINDPWDYCFFPGAKKTVSLHAAVAKQWLKRTLRTADLVTYPSTRLRDFHARLSGVKARSEIMVHVGTTADEHPAEPHDRSFCLVHAGKLGANELTGRSATALLRGFRRFLDTTPTARRMAKLVLVGPPDAATQEMVQTLNLHDVVESTGRVSYEASLKVIGSAQACVLIESNEYEGIYLASKLVDYIAARKPVLALSPDAGVVADMAVDGNIIRVNPTDVEGVQSAIARLYSAFCRDELESMAPPPAFAQTFAGEVVARKFLSAVECIIAPSELAQARAKDLTPVSP